jgi:hypothetical protein
VERSSSALWTALLLALPGLPSAQEASASVVLRWKADPRSASYELQVSTDASFHQPVLVVKVPTPGHRWFEIPTLRYYWRVRSLDAEGRPGIWSEVRTIEPALLPPEPRAPADGSRASFEGESPSLDVACLASRLAKRYSAEVAADPRFEQILARASGPAPTLHLSLPRAGQLFWRMRSTSLTGRDTGWSRVSRVLLERAPPPAPPRRPRPAPIPPIVTAPSPEPEPSPPPAPTPVVAAPPAGPIEEPAPAPEPLPEPPPPRASSLLRGGVQVGYFNNLKRVSSPWLALVIDWKTGLLADRLVLSARAATYSTSATVPAQPDGVPAPLSASARVFPISVLALYQPVSGATTLSAGAGPTIYLGRFTAGSTTTTAAVPGGMLVVAVGHSVGPGRAFVEAGALLGSFDRPSARLRAGGLLFTAGYELGR